jgi:hypothetical protein
MTGRDLMLFGKFKNTPLADVPADYVRWLTGQEGFSEKNPQLFAFFTQGEAAVSRPAEVAVINTEKALLASVSTNFTTWWMRAYGDRLRVSGELFYIPYLRVAIESWVAAEAQFAKTSAQSTPQPSKPAATSRQPINPLKEKLDDVKVPVDADGNEEF